MSELTTCDRAREKLASQNFVWGMEEIALDQARGRVLAEPLIADRDQPPFNRVAMDGIAINYSAYASGQRDFARARVQGAGEKPSPLTNPRECIEIMTGAALPAGCSTVIRYEDLVPTANGFVLPEGIQDAVNIHPQGKDTKDGNVLAEAPAKIGVATIGMLASCGYARVKVRALPRIALIATGDELVDVATTPEPHQIRRSNVYQLQSLLNQEGYQSTTHHLPDDPEILEEKLKEIISENELVILSGGVSKGKYDYIPSVLENLSVKRLFHGVAQRPGKPLWAGRNAATMVFGLPGNPQSSLSCCLAYVLPFIRRQTGLQEIAQYAELALPVTFKTNLTLFSYVAVSSDAQTGKLIATPVRHAGSGDASSLLLGNGFLELPAGQHEYPAGGIYQVRTF